MNDKTLDMTFRAIMLMDLHWGAISPEKMKKELEKELLSYIIGMEESNLPVHAIFIGGDLFDSKQYLSSDVTRYVLEFLSTLLDLTVFSHTYIYIIKGTRTHDDLQLQTVKTIMSMSRFHNRVYVIEEVTKLSLVDVHDTCFPYLIWMPIHPMSTYEPDENDTIIDILCVPEEYVVDQHEYYKDTIYNTDIHYDMIVGHGMVDKIWYAKKAHDHQSSITLCSSAPVFNVDDLISCSNYTYFGHVHMHQQYNDGKFQYVGPFTRWEFSDSVGNMLDAGYTVVEYDPITKTAYEKYHKNTSAQRLKVYAITIDKSMDLTSLNDYLNITISGEMQDCDRLKLIVNLRSDLENSVAMRGFIISKLGEMPFVKLVLKMIDSDIDIDDTLTLDDKEKSSIPDYFGKELAQSVKDFIKEKRNVDIPLEDISRVLNIKEE